MALALSPLPKLDTRRKALGISAENLAAMSGCSVATVRRVLRGDYGSASFDTVHAIAEALGMNVRLEPKLKPSDMRERRAMQKAEELVKLAQANSSLEGQGLGRDDLKEQTKLVAHKLLGGSPRKLWDDL